ncbi:MAG: hypothetical protein V7K40_33190 [Nostoc sp.]
MAQPLVEKRLAAGYRKGRKGHKGILLFRESEIVAESNTIGIFV